MRKEFLPFSKPSINEDDIQAVCSVLRSGWITTGPKCAEFEKTLAAYVGCKDAVAVTSATGGMHIALKALGIGPGDEVITPSMTWVSTTNLIALAGAKSVFVDIDPNTLMVPPSEIERALSPRTKLIIPVHYAGQSVDLDPIRAIASQAGVPIIEDAAHALGTYYRGEHVGKTGTAIFSFHPIKNITTGEGGMVVSDDPVFMERVKRLKFHGLGVDAFDRQTHGRAPQAEVLEPGYKYNLPDMAAALGLGQLRRVDELNAKRRELAMIYRERLAEIPELIPLSDTTYPSTHSWHLFIVRLDTDKVSLTRDEFMKELKGKNIGTGLHFRAAHLQKYYVESMGTKRGMLPHTEWNSDRILSLPFFPDMTVGDLDDVIIAIKEVLKGRGCP